MKPVFVVDITHVRPPRGCRIQVFFSIGIAAVHDEVLEICRP